MKLDSRHTSSTGPRAGSAVLVMLVFIALVFIYVTANVRTLHLLGRDLKNIEVRQVRHWEAFSKPHTNAPPTSAVASAFGNELASPRTR